MSVRAAFLLMTTVCLGCSEAPVPEIQEGLDFERQTGAFAAALRHVTGQQQVDRIDPRPVKSILSASPGEAYHHVDSSLVSVQAEQIRELGIEPGSVLVREGCSGFLVPPGHRQTWGCPQVGRTEIAFGLLRQEEDGRWLMTVHDMGYSPRGFMVEHYDLVMEHRGTCCTVVEETPRTIVE